MDWLDKLKDYAPDIAAAVLSGGATLPQLAMKAVSDAVGADIKDESSLKSYVDSANPETMLKVTQANNAFTISMKQLDVELGMAELKNQENARESHKLSNIPALVTLGMTLIMGGVLYALFVMPVPDENKDVLYMLAGQASALWAASITYWVGTTRSSAEKTHAIKKK